MKKKVYFGSNLKMYKTISETITYLTELAAYMEKLRKKYEELELFILPSFTALEHASRETDPDQIRLGAQNMCWDDFGKYTGEISPVMLEEMGLDLVMIGHSERRHVFGETDEEENRKVKTALSHGFTALLCIGETARQKEYGIAEEVLKAQLKIGLHDLKPEQAEKIWIAYEPVWSIGEEGTPATPEYIENTHCVIKDTLSDIFPKNGSDIPVFYGGSVNRSNAPQVLRCPSVDGLFVGRSAWNAKNFACLIEESMGG